MTDPRSLNMYLFMYLVIKIYVYRGKHKNIDKSLLQSFPVMMLCSHLICVSTNECLRYYLFCDSADNCIISSTICTKINITQTYLHQHTFDNNKGHSACNYIARRIMYFSFDRGKGCKIRSGWKGEIKAGCVIFVRSVLHYGW